MTQELPIKISRRQLREQAEKLLVDLPTVSSLADYAIVCDESNNTEETINNLELHVFMGEK